MRGTLLWFICVPMLRARAQLLDDLTEILYRQPVISGVGICNPCKKKSSEVRPEKKIHYLNCDPEKKNRGFPHNTNTKAFPALWLLTFPSYPKTVVFSEFSLLVPSSYIGWLSGACLSLPWSPREAVSKAWARDSIRPASIPHLSPLTSARASSRVPPRDIGGAQTPSRGFLGTWGIDAAELIGCHKRNRLETRKW